jgi:hypothetical protein
MVCQTQPYLFNLILDFSMDYFAISFGIPTFIFAISYLIFEIVTYMLSAFPVLNKLVSFYKKKTTKIFLLKKYNFISN